MRLSRLLPLAASFALSLGLVAAVPAQAVERPLPVSYSFLPSAVLAGLGVDADPPGANDWSCTPSTEHPNPVVLVHGLVGNKATNWQTFAPLLANEGYCVFALTYGQTDLAPAPLNQVVVGLTRIEDSAEQLSAFVDRVLAATGTDQVDILGHSEGTVMPNYYAKFLDGQPKIDKYVSIAPIWHGTNPAALDTVAPRHSVRCDPDRLQRPRAVLRLRPPAAGGIRVHEEDALGRPTSSRSSTQHPRRVPCRLVLPFLGSLRGQPADFPDRDQRLPPLVIGRSRTTRAGQRSMRYLSLSTTPFLPRRIFRLEID